MNDFHPGGLVPGATHVVDRGPCPLDGFPLVESVSLTPSRPGTVVQHVIPVAEYEEAWAQIAAAHAKRPDTDARVAS